MIKPQDFAYNLPEHLIAQSPQERRDHSKLMVVNRATQEITHRHFYELSELLTDNDCLVINDTKVIPARLFGSKASGGRVEILLLKAVGPTTYQAMCSPGLKLNTHLTVGQTEVVVTAIDNDAGEYQLEFACTPDELRSLIESQGQMPLPPYIHTPLSEQQVRDQYQTVFAQHEGSSAAPTAGLHFTDELMAKLESKGVQIERVTLHVGPGTFQRLRPENLQTGELHQEFYQVKPGVWHNIMTAKKQGKRIIAVGTTSTRTLESEVKEVVHDGAWHSTRLFIHPPYHFQVVDAIITNFHLPESSLLMLVSAFTSSPQTNQKFVNFETSLIGKVYQNAIEHEYRFFSFGDASFIC